MAYEIYRINWLGSRSDDGWIDKEDIKLCDTSVRSVGYLINETPETIIISAHIAQDFLHSTMEIPKKAIIYMECINV